MSEFWQYIGVSVALAAAAIYLTVYYVRRRKVKSGCKACRLMQATQQSPSERTSSSKSTVN